MIHIFSEQDIHFEKNYLMIDSKRDSLFLRLDCIDHIKWEKQSYNRKNSDMITLYDENQSVIHKLLFDNRNISERVYQTLIGIIQERGYVPHTKR